MAPLVVRTILKRPQESLDEASAPPAQSACSDEKDGSYCGVMGLPRVDNAIIELACATCEHGGLSMLELRDAQRADALAQEGLTIMVGDLLDAVVAFNCSEHVRAEQTEVLPRFESADAISCKLNYFVGRMVRYTNISPCNLMVGLIYLQRINTLRKGGLRITPYNCQVDNHKSKLSSKNACKHDYKINWVFFFTAADIGGVYAGIQVLRRLVCFQQVLGPSWWYESTICIVYVWVGGCVRGCVYTGRK